MRYFLLLLLLISSPALATVNVVKFPSGTPVKVCQANDTNSNCTIGSGGVAGYWTASGTTVYNNNAGNVGVNSTNPSATLDVLGTTRTTNLTLTSISSGTQCLQANSSGVISGTGSSCSSGGGGGGSGTPTGNQGNIQFLDISGTLRNFGGNDGLTYTGTGSTAGNVGIGSTNPNQTLDISGTLAMFGNKFLSGTFSGSGTSGDIYLGVAAGPSTSPAYGNSNIVIGDGTLTNFSTGSQNVVIGNSAGHTGSYAATQNVILGYTSALNMTSGGTNVIIGANAGDFITSNNHNVVVGQSAASLGNLAQGKGNCLGTTLLGYNTQCSTGSGGTDFNYGISLGYAASQTASNQMVVGDSNGTGYITDAYLGSGATATSSNLKDFSLHASGASGSNVGGANLILDGGQSTGTGSGGSIILKTSAAGSTGSSLNSLIEAVRINSSGNVGIGSTLPGAQLDVQGTVRSATFVKSGGTSSQFLKADGSTDASTYLTGNQNITLSNDITGSGTASITTTLKNTGTSGTYRSTTFDAQGRETSGTNPTTFSGYGLSDSSANLRSALTDSTGTGSAVFATSPNLGANVGINSASPGQTLDITGTTRTIGLISTVLTASKPVISDANKQLASGSYQGNTTTINTASGAYTSGNLLKSDVNANVVDAGAALGTLTDTKFCTYTSSGSTINCTSSSGGSASAAGGTNAVQYNSGSSTFAGTEAVFSMNGTNVGIGTNSGKQLLDVQGTVTVNAFEVNANGNIGIGTTLGTAAVSVMSGNFGIGTWLPTTLLDVGRNHVFSVDSTGNTTAAKYKSGSDLEFTSNGSMNLTFVGATNQLQFNTDTGFFQFRTTSAEKMRLSNVGNLGIGTVVTGSKLTVAGGIGIGTFTSTSYINDYAAPNGGMIAQGNVGIGTFTPLQALDVIGTIRVANLGGSFAMVTGTNSCMGQSALSGGTVTVSTTCAPSSSTGVFVTDGGGGTLANIGSLSVGTLTAGTSFVCQSSNALDSSNCNWVIIKTQ